MKLAVKIVGVLIGLGVLFMVGVLLYGATLPQEHVVARRATLQQPPTVVWDVISDVRRETEWLPGLAKVESAPPAGARETWIVTDEHGGAMKMTVEAAEPPRRMVRHYYEDKGRFDGRWEYDLAPAGEGTRITLTERGKFSNPFYRGLAHLLLGPDKFVTDYLKALGKKLGQEVTVKKAARSGRRAVAPC